MLHGDLSYKIIGAVYAVYNQIGYGYKEKEYQKALGSEFGKLGIPYQREVYSSLIYQNQKIKGFYLDFLVDNKIILELKVANDIYPKYFQQVLQYLKSHGLEVGIIAAFTPQKILIKRIINTK